mmetsp:Transcript_64592/g.173106  ORF Transcript_64592/g.173106 Transcript_64592/m.173106 type:complete len:291 (-) Transcript_64592:254-1126(-)
MNVKYREHTSCHRRLDWSMQKKIRHWVRFRFSEEQSEKKNKEILGDPSIPEELRMELAKCIQIYKFDKVPYLVHENERTCTAFSAELVLRAHTKYVPAFHVVADATVPANMMMIIMSGSVEIRLASGHQRHLAQLPKYANRDRRERLNHIHVLKRGDVIGDCGILGDRRWAGSYGIVADFIALRHCSLLCVPNGDIDNILGQFEFLGLRRRVNVGAKFLSDYQVPVQEETKNMFKYRDVFDDEESPWATFHWIRLARSIVVVKFRPPPLEPENSGTMNWVRASIARSASS